MIPHVMQVGVLGKVPEGRRRIAQGVSTGRCAKDMLADDPALKMRLRRAYPILTSTLRGNNFKPYGLAGWGPVPGASGHARRLL